MRNHNPYKSLFILSLACLACLWQPHAHARDIHSARPAALKEKTAAPPLTAAGIILRAAELKVRLTDLENRVAAFPDADAAAGAFAAIKENLAVLESRIKLLDPDRLYLNFDYVTSWQFNLSEIIVPNSDLIANPVTNWTLSDRRMRIVIPVGVAYGSDVEVVLQTLMDCAMVNANVSRKPDPLVMFKKFGDSALEFELHVWIHDINERHKVRIALPQDLESRLRDAGITIAFPQRDIHIRSGDQTMSKKLSLTQRRDDATKD